MHPSETLRQERLLTLISGQLTRKEFRNLTINQMLELGRLATEEGVWKLTKNNERINYALLPTELQFECIFDPGFEFHKVLDRIDIFVSTKGDVFLSEKAN